MSDIRKTRLVIFLALCALILPLFGLAIGWVGWDIRVGTLVGLGSFVLFFVLAGLTLTMVDDLTRFTIMLPFIIGTLYSLLPDFIPGPVDDAAAVGAGAIFTFALALKRDSETPRSVILPLLFSGLYTLIGGLIPGPVDEFVVAVIMAGTAAMLMARQDATGYLEQE